VSPQPDVNVVGGKLLPCSVEPLTGFYRNGCCSTGPEDIGSHTVCVILTEYGFAGLRPGDRWCLCASRWLEAHNVGRAPDVVLGATHARALDIVPIELLTSRAVAPDPS
jgi:uncharacterized protein (DUF2237 family)